MAETVTVKAAHLLKVLLLVGECIEDLSEDEQVMLEELNFDLTVQSPETFQAYSDKCEAMGAFYQVAVEGGLMNLGPEHSDGCREGA